MPDERQDSIRQGIHAPEQSPEGEAAERNREKNADAPEIGGGMDGTSDVESTRPDR